MIGPLFSFQAPNPLLRNLIREHQIIRFAFGPDSEVPVKPYWPRPACAIAFYPRDREWISGMDGAPAWRKPRAAVIGQPTGMTWRQVGRDYLVYQIELQPGALLRLTGVPGLEQQDQHLDAEALLPTSFRELAARLTQIESPAEMIAHSEAWFLTQLDRCPGLSAMDRLAGRLIANPELGLDRLAAAAGVGARQLRRQFQDRTGVGPKLLARIARFDRLVRQRNADPSIDWLELAVSAGYHDYQHLARDFRDFTGTTPARFSSLEQAAPERGFGFKET